MANSIFDQLCGNVVQDKSGIGQLQQAVQNMQRTFTGNPKQEVERLLQSGAMSQAQFNELAQMANQLFPKLH